MNLPYFKYYLNPISTGVIIKSDKECPVCHKKTGYEYVGPSYSYEEVKGICPWCIKNGAAAEKYDLTFVNKAEIDFVNNIKSVEELTKRTPGHFFPQEDNWKAHCGEFCTLVEMIPSNFNFEKYNIKDDIESVIKKLEITEKIFIEDIRKGVIWGTVFKCEKCGKYIFTADYE